MTLNTQATSLPAATTVPIFSSWCLEPNSPSAVTLATRTVPHGTGPPVIFIVDHDQTIREIARDVLERDGYVVHSFASANTVLQEGRKSRAACLIIDPQLLGMSAVELIHRANAVDPGLPIIIAASDATVTMAVQALQAGAIDFIEKPFRARQLLDSVEAALEPVERTPRGYASKIASPLARFGLTKRQKEILDLILNGHPSKNIAADLGISQRTVENHRAAIMKKTGSKSLPELVRLSLVAA